MEELGAVHFVDVAVASEVVLVEVTYFDDSYFGLLGLHLELELFGKSLGMEHFKLEN